MEVVICIDKELIVGKMWEEGRELWEYNVEERNH
jgi:hypothetical protein